MDIMDNLSFQLTDILPINTLNLPKSKTSMNKVLRHWHLDLS